MAKTYDIVELVGPDSFTYQLYNNLAPVVEGSSTVSCTLSAADFFRNFSFSFQSATASLALESYFATIEEFSDTSSLFVDVTVVYNNGVVIDGEITISTPGHTAGFGQDGSFFSGSHLVAVNKEGGLFNLYLDGTLVASIPSVAFDSMADLASSSSPEITISDLQFTS